ncbi:Zinc finger, C3HC4 type (RING finger) protein [Rhizoctonia solani]|uniref:Zinc finger, C3HC4 type (RING finger) protein n=1 Tax=Rhizoctonia solani TaxID=456999 RepID=A0A8H8P866_9AGAM|nr:Zinc finger, C3HC4 type (RING finger) protein [Rhizoctonia solani]QRW27319.1 Zinc finger, C3HC4 type (RING finger) protein [Rhizoctonia solani]
MSDDEYYGDDDVFTSDALDNIPALNQAPSPVTPVSTLPSPAVQQPPQVTSTSLSIPGSNASNPIVVGSVNDLAQTPVSHRTTPESVRRTNSRFSTIMNALRSGSTQRSSPSGVFGPQTGLLQFSKGKERSASLQSGTYQSNAAGPSRLSFQSSPLAGSKRRRASSSVREDFLEAEARADSWSVMEEELTCAICCDVYVAPQITACGHSACAPCLKIWLSRNNNCPICRSYINPSIKLVANRLASSMVDRMIAEAKKHTLPDWCPGGTKEAEWSKRKRLWVAEEARDAAAAVQARNQVNARVARAITRPRFHLPQPLFLEDEDEEEDDYYNIDDLGYEDEYDYNLL